MKGLSKKMQYFAMLICGVVFAMSVFTACKKNDNDVDDELDTVIFDEIDLYYTGYELDNTDINNLKYWKNLTVYPIQTSERVLSSDIEVKNKEVYVLGHFQKNEDNAVRGNEGAFWKNGKVLYRLVANQGDVMTTVAMKIQNNDVHIAGHINERQVAYWKNGQLQIWASNDTRTQVRAIEVVGNDVYIVGDVYSNETEKYVIKYWKNGVEHSVSDPQVLSYGADIKIVGSDVYVLGTTINFGNRIVLWKNGTPSTIGDVYGPGYARHLIIEGNDVYIGAWLQLRGQHHQPLVFKNGVSLPLDFDPSASATYFDMCVHNGNVYAIGSQQGKGIIWRNGEATFIEHLNFPKIFGVPK